jgi:hypothetical protein
MTTLPSIAAGGCVHTPPRCDSSNPTHASTRMEGGQAVFENDNYRITMGDNNTVTIHNKNTGETYQAWGDPHMNVDGQHAFDFWGTTTLKLEDGTKLTIETTPWAQNNAMTLSSRVTITNGDYGVQVSGIDTNRVGDLKIDEAKGWGETLDWAVKDGNVLHENPAGKGFVAMDSNGRLRAVDQQYINETDLMKGGAQKVMDRYENAFRMMSSLLSISFVGGFLNGFGRGFEAGLEAGLRGRQRDDDGSRQPHTGQRHLPLAVDLALTLMRA